MQALWLAYQKAWQDWAADERRARSVQERYSKLFDFHQKLSAFGETFELRMGLGYLVWRTPEGHEVRRHLLTARAELHFDALHGVLSVTAAGDGARTALEQDMLEPGERPLKEVINNVQSQLEDNGEDLWSGETMPGLLQRWVNAAGERGVFEDSLGTAAWGDTVSGCSLGPCPDPPTARRAQSQRGVQRDHRPGEDATSAAGQPARLRIQVWQQHPTGQVQPGQRRAVLPAPGQRRPDGDHPASGPPAGRSGAGTARHRQVAHHRQPGQPSARHRPAGAGHQPYRPRPQGAARQVPAQPGRPVCHPPARRGRRAGDPGKLRQRSAAALHPARTLARRRAARSALKATRTGPAAGGQAARRLAGDP